MWENRRKQIEQFAAKLGLAVESTTLVEKENKEGEEIVAVTIKLTGAKAGFMDDAE
jgi:hypothetical protein